MPSQLDPESPAANGGTAMLIHNLQSPVDHLTIQAERYLLTSNHEGLTCNLHRPHSWCNLSVWPTSLRPGGRGDRTALDPQIPHRLRGTGLSVRRRWTDPLRAVVRSVTVTFRNAF